MHYYVWVIQVQKFCETSEEFFEDFISKLPDVSVNQNGSEIEYFSEFTFVGYVQG